MDQITNSLGEWTQAQQVPDDFNSWLFFGFTLFLAIVINILSSYLKPRLDKFLAKRSDTRRKKLIEKEREFSLKVLWVSADQGRINSLGIENIRQFLSIIFSICIGLLGLVAFNTTTEETFVSFISNILIFLIIMIFIFQTNSEIGDNYRVWKEAKKVKEKEFDDWKNQKALYETVERAVEAGLIKDDANLFSSPNNAEEE